MAATVRVKEAMWRVSVLLQDSVPQYQRWPEYELVGWLNDACMAIAKFLPASCSRLDAVKLRAGTKQSIESIATADCKPGDGSTPTTPIIGIQVLDVSRNMGTDGLTPGRAIRRIEREALDSQSPEWHSVSASVVSSYMFDPQLPMYFWVTPGVSAVGGPYWVDLSYLAQPIKIPSTTTLGSELYRIDGSSTALISVADQYLDDIVNYAVARANMKPVTWADSQKAQAFASMFLNSLNAKVQALGGANPNLKMLPFAPQPLAQAS
jgi:hypothetical protein